MTSKGKKKRGKRGANHRSKNRPFRVVVTKFIDPLRFEQSLLVAGFLVDKAICKTVINGREALTVDLQTKRHATALMDTLGKSFQIGGQKFVLGGVSKQFHDIDPLERSPTDIPTTEAIRNAFVAVFESRNSTNDDSKGELDTQEDVHRAMEGSLRHDDVKTETDAEGEIFIKAGSE